MTKWDPEFENVVNRLGRFDGNATREELENLVQDLKIEARLNFLKTYIKVLLIKDFKSFNRLDDALLKVQSDASLKTDAQKLYKALFDLSFEQISIGAWPIVLHDLMVTVNTGNPLLTETYPDLIQRHPSTEFPDLLNLEDATRFKQVFEDGEKALIEEALIIGGAAWVGIGVFQAIEWFTAKSLEHLKAEQEKKEQAAKKAAAIRAEQERQAEEARRAQQSKAEREFEDRVRSAKPMRDASNHVDAFERNSDWIGRTA